MKVYILKDTRYITQERWLIIFSNKSIKGIAIINSIQSDNNIDIYAISQFCGPILAKKTIEVKIIKQIPPILRISYLHSFQTGWPSMTSVSFIQMDVKNTKILLFLTVKMTCYMVWKIYKTIYSLVLRRLNIRRVLCVVNKTAII